MGSVVWNLAGGAIKLKRVRSDLVEIANNIDPDTDIGVQSDSSGGESSSSNSGDSSSNSDSKIK